MLVSVERDGVRCGGDHYSSSTLSTFCSVTRRCGCTGGDALRIELRYSF